MTQWALWACPRCGYAVKYYAPYYPQRGCSHLGKRIEMVKVLEGDENGGE